MGLQGWLRQMGKFLKEKAPNQLVLAGVEGYFGPHSPHHLPYNPPAQVSVTAGAVLPIHWHRSV
jgi:hypothetical protein